MHYIQIIRHGVVDAIGDVYTGNMKLAQFTCTNTSPNEALTKKLPFSEKRVQLYDEVFVTSQKYNDVLYHATIEDLPRAIPYLEFLRNHKNIKIHTGHLAHAWATMFKMLRISSDRMVNGPVRAKIVYLPQSTPCGLNQVQALQLTSHLLRQQIVKRQPEEIMKMKSIVLIKRSGKRRFKFHDQIQEGLSVLAEEFNLRFEELHDKHLPGMDGISSMFQRAKVIVGPHGAGLLNMVFSEPGTMVVEGVCYGGDMVLYYLWEAHTLGHHWHGVPVQTEACDAYIDSSPDEIFRVVRHFLSNNRTK